MNKIVVFALVTIGIFVNPQARARLLDLRCYGLDEITTLYAADTDRLSVGVYPYSDMYQITAINGKAPTGGQKICAQALPWDQDITVSGDAGRYSGTQGAPDSHPKRKFTFELTHKNGKTYATLKIDDSNPQHFGCTIEAATPSIFSCDK